MKVMKDFDLEKVSGGSGWNDYLQTALSFSRGMVDGWYDQNKIGTGCK